MLRRAAVALGVLAMAISAAGSTAAGSTAAGSTPPPPIDGIPCDQGERQAMHIHVHLAVYAGGVERPIPAGVGVAGGATRQTSRGPLVVAGRCYYWLHTHTGDGIVHVEAPYPRSFTLGEFFDIWSRALGSRQVGDDRGPVTAYLDGARFRADPRTLKLADHAAIQLDVGVDTPPRPYWFGFTPGPFLLAGALSAGAVALAALAASWSWPARLLATGLAFVLVASWQTACGLLGVDAAGPVGDVVVAGGSVVAGGLVAAVAAARAGPGGVSRWLPAIAGAAAGGLGAAFLS